MFTISTGYPGANILVRSIVDDTVTVEQDIRDTGEWWFYWNFCVEGAQGWELVFRFANGEVVGPWGPCVRRESDASGSPGEWKWADPECIMDRSSFRFRFGPEDARVRFAFSFPYQVADYEAFMGSRNPRLSSSSGPEVSAKDVATTAKGRKIPMLEIGTATTGRKLLFTARHHACESPASYQLEGMLQYLFESKDSILTTDYSVLVLPFMDLDGVEDGDQGKSRLPHDHNRDYGEDSLYESVRAVKNLAAENNIVGAFDLHSPWKWGGRDDHFFFVGKPEKYDRFTRDFGEILARQCHDSAEPGDILYEKVWDMPYGVDWNSGKGHTCSRYFIDRNAEMVLGTEIPYFGTGETVFTPRKLRKFGCMFARALEEYLLSLKA